MRVQGLGCSGVGYSVGGGNAFQVLSEWWERVSGSQRVVRTGFGYSVSGRNAPHVAMGTLPQLGEREVFGIQMFTGIGLRV